MIESPKNSFLEEKRLRVHEPPKQAGKVDTNAVGVISISYDIQSKKTNITCSRVGY